MGTWEVEWDAGISIHALLAESDSVECVEVRKDDISIHALLAESDSIELAPAGIAIKFLSTLSLRRATTIAFDMAPYMVARFLSTLSLRRATLRGCPASSRRRYFYPRSPCGERPVGHQKQNGVFRISIHALLAESDVPVDRAFLHQPHFYPRSPCGERREYWVGGYGTANNFYPRSPCGERLTTVLH